MHYKNSLHDVECPVCSSGAYHELTKYRSKDAVFAGLELLRCDECALVFAAPLPTEEKLRTYNESYWQRAHGGTPTEPLAIRFHSEINRVRFLHVQAYLGEQHPGTAVLEVGPGLGHFCAHFLSEYPAVEYVAVESDISCYARLRELGAQVCASFDELEHADGHFDLLVMSHVLEHTSSPRAFLQQALQFLRPGGVLFVEVPCRDHEFKEIHESHLLFFDKPSMLRLIECLGLTDIQLSYHGKELHRLKWERRLWRRLYRKSLSILGVLLLPARDDTELNTIDDVAIQKVIDSYEAHLTKEKPSWWLRALAAKPM